jgi:phosphate transport system protein
MAAETEGVPPAPDKFHRELASLKDKLLELARLAEQAMERSVSAFLKRDENLALQIIKGDKAVNELEETIDGECVRLIALFQPVAIDLRQLMAVDHISAELERLGDSATNIAEEVLALKDLPPEPAHPELPQMARDVQEMVRQSLLAFLQRDPQLAREICKADNVVDELDRDIITELLEDMTGNPGAIPAGQSQINVVRNLERMGDHATNIAEQVVYMVEGESVRHRCQG